MSALLFALFTGLAQDWPQWRGPSFDGASAVGGLPRAITAEAGVRWRAELPGPGAATPVVLGTRVFVTAAVEEAGVLLSLCYDRASGALLWEDSAGSGYGGPKTRRDERSDYASPSPVADAERVVFLFGNGDLVAYEHGGKRLWAKNLQELYGAFAFQWTFGASPTLFDGRLYLPILQRDQPTDGRPSERPIPSFLLALEASTGKELFRVERPSEARLESLESYATAIPYVTAERRELLVVGGDVLTGHDLADGRELWRYGTWNEGHREPFWRLVPSPVVGAGHVLVCAPKRAPVYAVKLGGSGSLGPEALAWQSSGRANPVSSDVPTPLYYRERFFVLSESGKLSRVEPASGKVEWTVELPDRTPWEASPTGADGCVWCLSHGGKLVAVEAESGKLVLEAALAPEDSGPVRSSVAAAHGALFVRTLAELVALGN